MPAAPNLFPIQFRIGINVGDIIIEGEDILGDGVNIAARIEGIAEPGGISISEDAWRQVQGKIAANFIDTGEQSLKNIARPVRIYRVKIDGEPGIDLTALPSHAPERSSIAVLPFQNMSGDPEQEHFCDGLVEDIITTLSKLAGLQVIARNSSFVYKGRSVDVREVAKLLGVRYILESVSKVMKYERSDARAASPMRHRERRVRSRWWPRNPSPAVDCARSTQRTAQRPSAEG